LIVWLKKSIDLLFLSCKTTLKAAHIENKKPYLVQNALFLFFVEAVCLFNSPK